MPLQHRVVTSPIISDTERLPAASTQECYRIELYSTTHFSHITTRADYCFCANIYGYNFFILLTFQQEWVWVGVHC